MKKCLGWHFEYCARKVPTLRIRAIHRMALPYGVPDQPRGLVGCLIAVTQPYGYRVVPYRVGTTA